MPSLPLTNIPDDLYHRLKAAARLHRRSLNSEILICIERAVRAQRITPEETLLRARALREKTARYTASPGEIDDAKRAGRP